MTTMKLHHKKNIKGTPFANGLFFGLFLGIVMAIIITLLVTSGKSPFISKKTEGSCIEVNSALGDEDEINIDEDTNIAAYSDILSEEQKPSQTMIETYFTIFKLVPFQKKELPSI
jgi:hypothetical protein